VLAIKKTVKRRLSNRIVKHREAQYNMTLEEIGVPTSSDGRAKPDSLATQNSMGDTTAVKFKEKSMQSIISYLEGSYCVVLGASRGPKGLGLKAKKGGKLFSHIQNSTNTQVRLRIPCPC
jgi:hypothetical protein